MKWYSYLVPQKNGKDYLLKYQKYEPGNYILCWQRDWRKFGFLKNVTAVQKLLAETEEQNKTYYELMMKDYMRKPYFDIDVDRKKYDYTIEDMDNFINKICDRIEELIPNIKDNGSILVFRSHTAKKFSYHIIVTGYSLADHIETKNFRDTVASKFDEKEQELIDPLVYKPIQQLRIIGCHKWGGNNTKILSQGLSRYFIIPDRYQNKKAIERYILNQSLVSNTEGCLILPGYAPKEEKREFKAEGCCSEEDVGEVLSLVYKKYPSENFQFTEVKENDGNLMLIFRRHAPSFCKICRRVHENDNPYVFVTGMNRDIYFDCRRSEGKRDFVGSLGPINFVPSVQVKSTMEIKKERKKEQENLIVISDSSSDEETEIKKGESIDKMSMLSKFCQEIEDDEIRKKEKKREKRKKNKEDIKRGKILVRRLY